MAAAWPSSPDFLGEGSSDGQALRPLVVHQLQRAEALQCLDPPRRQPVLSRDLGCLPEAGGRPARGLAAGPPWPRSPTPRRGRRADRPPVPGPLPATACSDASSIRPAPWAASASSEDERGSSGRPARSTYAVAASQRRRSQRPVPDAVPARRAPQRWCGPARAPLRTGLHPPAPAWSAGAPARQPRHRVRSPVSPTRVEEVCRRSEGTAREVVCARCSIRSVAS